MFLDNQTQQNMTKSSNLLQNPLWHLEALFIPYADTQEPNLHLKIFKNEGMSIPHCLVGCLTPKEIN